MAISTPISAEPVTPQAARAGTALGAPGPAASRPGLEPFGRDGLTFFDVLDVINPLQHIPVVSTIYRELTGDGIDPVPRIAGGALFGGVIGAVSSLVNVIVEALTGRDIGDHVLAALTEEAPADDGLTETMLAAAGSATDGMAAPTTGALGAAAWAIGDDASRPWVADWARQELGFRAMLAAQEQEATPALPAAARYSFFTEEG